MKTIYTLLLVLFTISISSAQPQGHGPTDTLTLAAFTYVEAINTDKSEDNFEIKTLPDVE